MKRCIGPLFAAAVLGLPLTACGSSSPLATTVTVQREAALSRAQFISQGDAICQETREASESLKDQVSQLHAEITLENESSQFRRIGELISESDESTSAEIEQLRSLQPPRSDRKTINRMLALVDSQVSLDEELAHAFETGDTGKMEALEAQAKPIKAKAQGIAQGYGFKVCGSE